MAEKDGEDVPELVTAAQANRYLAEKSIGQADWSGLPMPVLGLRLVIEPRYRHQGLSEFEWKEYYDENGVRHTVDKPPPTEPSDLTFVNSWWNETYRLRVVVTKDVQGRAKLRFTVNDHDDSFSLTLRTLNAASAWPVEAERRAGEKLAKLITGDLFELYQLTGHFPEVSARSGVTYLLRRGRPTVAYREAEDSIYPLCALCLHPIGYYQDTWAGVMCPTDEVIAHLLMIRGCEAKFWANANQHPFDRPSAGL